MVSGGTAQLAPARSGENRTPRTATDQGQERGGTNRTEAVAPDVPAVSTAAP